MADFTDDLFGGTNKTDTFGAYRRREMKVVAVNGKECMVQITHIESEIGGVLNEIEEMRYLCQDCGISWVTPGLDGFSKNGKILCPRCSRRDTIKKLLKPLWSPFIKLEENK
jgi:DNA-directed RNA polymerase subunit RPC12/RpoP